jgi:hypothetical protein
MVHDEEEGRTGGEQVRIYESGRSLEAAEKSALTSLASTSGAEQTSGVVYLRLNSLQEQR